MPPVPRKYSLINYVHGLGAFVAQPDLYIIADSLGLWLYVGRQPEQTRMQTRFDLEIDIAGLGSQRAQAPQLEKLQKSPEVMSAAQKSTPGNVPAPGINLRRLGCLPFREEDG